jgi:hypothetical protein
VGGNRGLAVPLDFDRPAAGSSVSIPRTFIPCHRLLAGRERPLVADGHGGIEMDLRFQLPAAVQPITIERATLAARIRAPGRKVTILGHGLGGPVALLEVEGPIDPLRIEVADPGLLALDPEGGLRLTLRIGEQTGAPPARQDPGKAPPPKKFGPTGPNLKSQEAASKTAEPWPDLIWKIESMGLDVAGRTVER